MAKKTGLGKGLDALFSTKLVVEEEEKVQEGETIQNLKLEINREKYLMKKL